MLWISVPKREDHFSHPINYFSPPNLPDHYSVTPKSNTTSVSKLLPPAYADKPNGKCSPCSLGSISLISWDCGTDGKTVLVTRNEPTFPVEGFTAEG